MEGNMVPKSKAYLVALDRIEASVYSTSCALGPNAAPDCEKAKQDVLAQIRHLRVLAGAPPIPDESKADH
jgi:hypothetical protein